MTSLKIYKAAILAERLRRQGLLTPIKSASAYPALFRKLQPVSTYYFTRPGSPPALSHRTAFDDGKAADRMRARREIIKGRFLGGGIGYVLQDDLELYARAFRKPLPQLTPVQAEVCEAVRNEGPLTPRQIKDVTGMLNKRIMPALHRLQEAFLVYEDQTDEDWERSWYDFGSEWPDVDLDADREGAVRDVLCRFLSVMVWAGFENIKDWSQLPVALLKKCLGALEADGRIVPVALNGECPGWMPAEDAGRSGGGSVPSTVFMMHRGDMLVKAHACELKRNYGKHEVLQYLLIDGEFRGAVLGHWRIGPHDVDDIVLDLPAGRKTALMKEVVAEVSSVYHPPFSRILRYDGRRIT